MIQTCKVTTVTFHYYRSLSWRKIAVPPAAPVAIVTAPAEPKAQQISHAHNSIRLGRRRRRILRILHSFRPEPLRLRPDSHDLLEINKPTFVHVPLDMKISTTGAIANL